MSKAIVPKSSGISAEALLPSDAVALDIGDADFSEIEVVLQPNYYDGFAQQSQRTKRVTVQDYLNAANDKTYAGMMCVETPLPKQIASEIKLHVSAPSVSDTEAVCLFHAGRRGSIAPLHYDWDHRWVLHVCLTGRKTVYLIPPEAGWLLNPIINTSSICVPRLSAVDRADFLRRLDGTEVELRAGQAVLFPSLWWHAVSYEAPSASISVRFGERPELRPFAVLPRSFWLQRLVWQFFRSQGKLAPHGHLKQCLRTFFKAGISEIERYHNMYAMYRKMLSEMGQSFGVDYLTSEGFNAEENLANNEILGLYSVKIGRGPVPPSETVEAVRRYLFAKPSSETSGTVVQRALAKYALAQRQGLQPRRGLIRVHHTGRAESAACKLAHPT